MSAHLCKQIYASWRQTHDHSTTATYNQAPDRALADDKHYFHVSTPVIANYMPHPRSFSPQKRSMDSDRSDEER